MIIVLDSNVLFSALIRDALTRRMILKSDETFLFPEFIFEEFQHHKHELYKKSKMSTYDFEKLLELLLTKVHIVSTMLVKEFKDEAYSIVKDIDPDDTIFIACCLAYKNSVLWPDDKKLKNQKRVIVYTTTQIKSLLSM
ncbi:MAG: PIN domain-containing protein [Candidatus Woesearchaeota archaeon]